jgi:hypothetical protein
MKPVAPELLSDDAQKVDQPTLQSEIRRLCDAKASSERITLPAPPTEEALRASTPFPPRDPDTGDTLPAPPPSAARKRTDGERHEAADADDTLPATIPGPPPLPRIAGA